MYNTQVKHHTKCVTKALHSAQLDCPIAVQMYFVPLSAFRIAFFSAAPCGSGFLLFGFGIKTLPENNRREVSGLVVMWCSIGVLYSSCWGFEDYDHHHIGHCIGEG